MPRNILPKSVTLVFGRLVLGLLFAGLTASVARAEQPRRIPVILDTDIGDDIDDTWALALLLKSPELDLKLAVGDYGRTGYRARLLAKFLDRTGHGEVPVGVGMEVVSAPPGEGRQAEWVKGYELKSYPGRVYPDGVQAIIDTIMHSPQPVTLICIGPAPNIAAALKREPRIAKNARVVAMAGSIYAGYEGSKKPSAEWNVVADPKAMQAVFAAPWEITITPLDTCGRVVLSGDQYKLVREGTGRIATNLITNYRLWAAADPNPAASKNMAEEHSSTLFDTVAVYLAMHQDFCGMEKLPLRVTDDGYTSVDPQGRPVLAATEWKDKGAYEDFLVKRLCSPEP